MEIEVIDDHTYGCSREGTGVKRLVRGRNCVKVHT